MTSPNPPTPPLRVVAIDDHPVMLRGIVATLMPMADIEVVHAATTVASALAARGAPDAYDVALLDVELGDGSQVGDNVASLVAAGIGVVLFTNEHRPAMIGEALRSGALALALKGDPETQLAEAIRSAARGVHFVSSRLALQITQDPAAHVHMSVREREVLERVALGMTWAAVAADLDISVATARTHMNRAMIAFSEAGLEPPQGPRDAVARSIQAGHIDPFRRP
ncbi:response regulator transcription factor [Serinibacter salmoneus]|uniref:LuxR family two component transcriptional regulator n=1 Tax=Serinibacter salmoneus TaxID=556530 RepID=A0A2A9CYV8_9MICO|nr:response regulator transcription factor [Serinibacter salmoneus]PFG18769.1 LuxR family two component transcriptional regulator [Serinibacter salmoneus]